MMGDRSAMRHHGLINLSLQVYDSKETSYVSFILPFAGRWLHREGRSELMMFGNPKPWVTLQPIDYILSE